MNGKSTLKVIKIIMGDKSITDSDKLEAIKKLIDTGYIHYYPYPDPYPLIQPYPQFPWDTPCYPQPQFIYKTGTTINPTAGGQTTTYFGQ